jgi:hypothetical protein
MLFWFELTLKSDRLCQVPFISRSGLMTTDVRFFETVSIVLSSTAPFYVGQSELLIDVDNFKENAIQMVEVAVDGQQQSLPGK